MGWKRDSIKGRKTNCQHTLSFNNQTVDRTDRTDRADQADRADRADRTDHTDHINRVNLTDRADRYNNKRRYHLIFKVKTHRI